MTGIAAIRRNSVVPAVIGQLLVTAGDNPARLRSDRWFARLCGVPPTPVSSGRRYIARDAYPLLVDP